MKHGQNCSWVHQRDWFDHSFFISQGFRAMKDKRPHTIGQLDDLFTCRAVNGFLRSAAFSEPSSRATPYPCWSAEKRSLISLAFQQTDKQQQTHVVDNSFHFQSFPTTQTVSLKLHSSFSKVVYCISSALPFPNWDGRANPSPLLGHPRVRYRSPWWCPLLGKQLRNSSVLHWQLQVVPITSRFSSRKSPVQCSCSTRDFTLLQFGADKASKVLSKFWILDPLNRNRGRGESVLFACEHPCEHPYKHLL